MGFTNNQTNTDSDEISLKELILKIKELWQFLLTKWLIILIAGIFGAIIGFTYAYLKKPIYNGALSFVLQDEKPGGSASGALGLASQFGVDLGGSGGGGEFSGDNLLELMKSRSMVEKALLSSITINNKEITIAEYYIDYNKMRDNWKGTDLENINFLPNADRSKFTLKQDSLLGVFHKTIIAENLYVNKLDKKLSIISLNVKSTNELFSKYFTETLAAAVSEFYIQSKTAKTSKNVTVLEHQVDSVRAILYSGISGAASSIDATPNPNPSLLTLRVPSQRRTVDVNTNTAVLTELFKQLVIAKTSLLQETPLIQVIDKPILPLDKEKLSKLKSLFIGGIVAVFFTILFLFTHRFFKTIMS